MLIAGVDEAGRGPLAGPVYAAAVILDPARPIVGLRDSKVLTAGQRERLAVEIRGCSLAWAVAAADVAEIDALNILQATLIAMRRAIEALALAPTEALIDGNRIPRMACAARAIVKGDRDIAAISAASILAKTGARCRPVGPGCAVPAVWICPEQGLWNARTPCRAGAPRSVP
jgi:ribonuclease HII